QTMVDLCRAVGRDCVALLTRMDFPLGNAVGNAVEVRESIEILRGAGPPDVRELTLLLGVEMLELAGVTGGRARLERALADGRARKEDAVDPAAGLLLRKRPGDPVRAGETLAELHAASEERLDAGAARFRQALAIADAAPPDRALVLERIAVES